MFLSRIYFYTFDIFIIERLIWNLFETKYLKFNGLLIEVKHYKYFVLKDKIIIKMIFIRRKESDFYISVVIRKSIV